MVKNTFKFLLSVAFMFQYSQAADLSVQSPNQQKNTFGNAISDAFIPGSGLNQQDMQYLISKTKSDPSWNEANKYLFDETYFYEGKATQSDVENKYSKIVVPKMPNYPKAIESLNRSVIISNNPVSAYEGMVILKSYLGYEKPEQKEMYNKFVSILYKAKHCDGFLSYADLQTTNEAKIKIYEEGLMKCNKIKPYSFLLGSQIARLKNSIKVK